MPQIIGDLYQKQEETEETIIFVRITDRPQAMCKLMQMHNGIWPDPRGEQKTGFTFVFCCKPGESQTVWGIFRPDGCNNTEVENTIRQKLATQKQIIFLDEKPKEQNSQGNTKKKKKKK